ncbi:aldo/keto reductase [Streptomyces carpinensis]|uniref:Aldo/keto reductase n=2 Tax=Streptomyces carpinensis TaxID=66369 RepID=A0ABV1VVM6_9ACTN
MTDAQPTVPSVELRDGTAIPQLGYGTLAVQPDREASDANAELTAGVVAEALRAGYRHLDTAQSYGTERGAGRAIAESGLPREELYVTSKLANPNHAPDEVHRSFDRTLEHLGLEHLDLFLIHWPLPMLYGGDYVSTCHSRPGRRPGRGRRSVTVSSPPTRGCSAGRCHGVAGMRVAEDVPGVLRACRRRLSADRSRRGY